MTTFELAGQAMMHMQDSNRGLAHALAEFFRRRTADKTSFSGATFLGQEPDLANEAKLPDYMRTI